MLVKRIKGGYNFKNFKGGAEDTLEEFSTSIVSIPLLEGLGVPLSPLVKEQDKVSCGQIIARNDKTISSCVHSSLEGEVVKIEKINYFKREVPVVTIKGEVAKAAIKVEEKITDWQNCDVKKLEEAIYKGGVSALEYEGLPTRFNTSVIKPQEVEDIIIKATEDDIYNVSLSLLLEGKNIYQFVDSLKILKRIYPQAKIHIAINQNKGELIEKITKLTSSLKDNIFIIPLPPTYPVGHKEVLIPCVLNKEFPYGYLAANIGVVVLSIETVLSIYRAVVEAEPVVEKIVALCGEGFSKNIHLRVRVGTPISEIIRKYLKKDKKYRIIANSLLTGEKISDYRMPLGRDISCLIALYENEERKFLGFMRCGRKADSYSRSFLSSFIPSKKEVDTNLGGEERPCIQCAYCIKVCPVGIMPNLLNRYIKVGAVENLMRLGIFNCISCNLCSYVCPCKIPLADNIEKAKEKLMGIGCDHSLCILPRFNLKGLEEYKGVKSIR